MCSSLLSHSSCHCVIRFKCPFKNKPSLLWSFMELLRKWFAFQFVVGLMFGFIILAVCERVIENRSVWVLGSWKVPSELCQCCWVACYLLWKCWVGDRWEGTVITQKAEEQVCVCVHIHKCAKMRRVC